MKKRLAKVLALGLTAAMVAGAPLSAMASEVNAADQAGETAVVAENADSADETEVDAGIASQDQNDASQDPVVNGVDPMSLDGVIQLDDGNWYYFDTCLGTMQTGFLQLPGKMVFYDQNTGKMLYGNQCIDGDNYYFNNCITYLHIIQHF